MTTSIVAAREMAARAAQNEKKELKRNITTKLMAERFVGLATIAVASPVIGFLDGRFDHRDDVLGDGTRVMGIPIVPVIGIAVAVGGAFVPGVGGTIVQHTGFAAVAGSFYALGQKEGLKAAQKAADKQGAGDE